ncbi:MAG TPA: response regulator, partial [Vicinamibacteria bacterium]
EDLPLLDIIQIVSFSKKTGYLSIRSEAGEAAIVFRDGFVIASFTWDSLPVDPRARSLPPDKREKLLRNRIEMALEQLIRLREGPFHFSLSDEAPSRVGSRDIADEMLDVGVNAQELLLDLARGMDEDRRDSTAALEASFAEPPPVDPGAAPPPGGYEEEFSFADTMEAPAPAPPAPPLPLPPYTRAVEPPPAPAPPPLPVAAALPPGAKPTILLVDDEPDVRRVLAQHFADGGYPVDECEDPEAAVKRGGALGKAGTPFLLVTDLGMPTSGGSSFQGGFEVVKRLWKMNLRPPVLLMTERLSGALQGRAKQMGIASFVFKPGLSKLDPEQFESDLRAFAAKIVSDILPRLVHAGAPPPEARPAGKPAPRAPAPGPALADLSPEFLALQRSLEELRGHGDASRIAGLVMRVAREFFERGVLFLVKDEEARGLAGFGAAPRGENLNLLARDIVIPLTEPSVFQDVAFTRRYAAGELPDGRWGQYLMGKIGRFRSSSMVLLPLLTNRETIALLFGDNPETGREPVRLEPLVVFINQAGIAMENAFLQRKIQALQGRD